MSEVVDELRGLDELIDRHDLLVTCGPGGVGKTTTAAALGLAAARRGRKVAVMTVDPARRLAEALGLDVDEGASLNEPHRVTTGRRRTKGELWALMLDAEETFDTLVREQTASVSQADAILNNPVYRAISGSLSGAQEYMAIERLHQLRAAGDFDLLIVDTPPSRHALDLLEAPDRLIGFLSHPVYRTLTAGQRLLSKVTDAAASMFLWAVRRLAGPQIVEDTVEFFRSLAAIEPGLRRRASEVAELLRSENTAFVVVASPRGEAVGEALHLIDGLGAREFPLGAVIANLLHPLPDALSPEFVDDATAAGGAMAAHVELHGQLRGLAEGERQQVVRLRNAAESAQEGVLTVQLPLLDSDVHDVDGLFGLADLLLDPLPTEELDDAAEPA